MKRSGWQAIAGAAMLLMVSAARGVDLQTYPTRYYVIHSDLNDDAVREAAIRMTRMAEEYSARTRGFSGQIRTKLPVYLFGNPDDYYATGAPRGSAGAFNGQVLMAVAKNIDARTWHIIQHEGFHQFADAVIGGSIPTWVNEGLAEYFGEAIFTGDGFVSGIIPQWRLQRVRQRFEKNQFRPIRQMMSLSLNDWNGELSVTNYDQAWSMVQFLAHGEDGRYQKAFGSFMDAIGRGKSWQNAWKSSFGDTEGFEQRWRQWWLQLPDNPSADLYAQVTTATLASFFARAFCQGQRFESFDDFVRVASAGQLKSHPDDWLPPGIISEAVGETRRMTQAGCAFSIIATTPGKPPQLICVMKDGKKLVATFVLRGGRVQSVRVE